MARKSTGNASNEFNLTNDRFPYGLGMGDLLAGTADSDAVEDSRADATFSSYDQGRKP